MEWVTELLGYPRSHDWPWELQNKCTPVLLNIKHLVRHRNAAKRPRSWATWGVFISAGHYLRMDEAPLPAVSGWSSLWRSLVQSPTTSRGSAGWMQASAPRQAGISPVVPNISAKSMLLSKAFNSYRSVLQTQWFLADPLCCDPALEDRGTVAGVHLRSCCWWWKTVFHHESGRFFCTSLHFIFRNYMWWWA